MVSHAPTPPHRIRRCVLSCHESWARIPTQLSHPSGLPRLSDTARRCARMLWGADPRLLFDGGHHSHLLLLTPHGNLGRVMRHIHDVSTQRDNRFKRTDGPLFRGRDKALLVDADHYLLQLSRYIHRNPVETKPPLVHSLDTYSWSSYPAYGKHTKSPQMGTAGIYL